MVWYRGEIVHRTKEKKNNIDIGIIKMQKEVQLRKF